MADEHNISRHRRWYRKLLGLYSQPYREQFAEGMEQTFHDLCRERTAAGKGLAGFALWVFIETFAGIVRDNMRITMARQKNIIRIAIVAGLILLIPLWGNFNVQGWNWSPFDFVFAFAILFGTGLMYELVASRGGSLAYRAAVGIACVAGFLLVWVNAAVGIIGDEDSANAMYFVVLLMGFVGACIARFEARGMSRVLFAMAVAQALVPLIALTWVPEERFSPGVVKVMGLNSFWVVMWIASGLLFRHAAEPWSNLRGDERGATR